MQVIFLVYNIIVDKFDKFFMHKCIVHGFRNDKIIDDLLTNFFLAEKMYNIRIFIVEKVFKDAIIS